MPGKNTWKTSWRNSSWPTMPFFYNGSPLRSLPALRRPDALPNKSVAYVTRIATSPWPIKVIDVASHPSFNKHPLAHRTFGLFILGFGCYRSSVSAPGTSNLNHKANLFTCDSAKRQEQGMLGLATELNAASLNNI
jgi:hypothetical protein